MMTLPIRRNDPPLKSFIGHIGLYAGLIVCLVLQCNSAQAVPIHNDPHGFEGIPWGTPLSEGDRFVKIEDDGHTQTYERKDGPPVLGAIPVDSLRFTAFRNRFGRVTVRYRGAAAHEAIVTYLQSTYGPLDRTPGQVAVGPVKVYAWHGIETDVTLRFEAHVERGIIFIESQTREDRWPEEDSSTVY